MSTGPGKNCLSLRWWCQRAQCPGTVPGGRGVRATRRCPAVPEHEGPALGPGHSAGPTGSMEVSSRGTSSFLVESGGAWAWQPPRVCWAASRGCAPPGSLTAVLGQGAGRSYQSFNSAMLMWTQGTIFLMNKITGLVKFLKHWASASLTCFHIWKFYHI